VRTAVHLGMGGDGLTESLIFYLLQRTPDNLNDNLFNGAQGSSNARPGAATGRTLQPAS
jgi:hypothetical protein